MVQEVSSGSMHRLRPNCDAKSKGINKTKQCSDVVKNCVKLVAFVAIVVLVLQYGTQQLQASKLPAGSNKNQLHNQQACCLEHVTSNIGNGSLFINSIDRHDRGFNDGPLITNGQTLLAGKVEQEKEQLQQNETAGESPIRSNPDRAIEIREDPRDKEVGDDANSDLATMASNGFVLLPKMIQNRITLDQLAKLHENFDSFVEQPTIQHPNSQLDQLASRISGSVNSLLADAQDIAIKRQDNVAASVNQPYLADPTVTGSNAGLTTDDLIAAQAINNYGQEDPSGEDNDDDSSPDFDEPADSGQNQDRADSEEGNNNAVAQQHQLNSVMQPMNEATNVYEGNIPRHVDLGSSLTQDQSNDSPDKTATNNIDDSPVISPEQMLPDSIESLMRSGGETGPLDTDGSNEEPSAADEPDGNPNQQLAAGGTNYAQNVELPGVTPQDMLLAGNAAAYQVPASLPGVTPAHNAVSDDDDDDQDNDDDDEGNKSNGITSSLAPAALNQQVSFPDNRLPTQLGNNDQSLMTDSNYIGPTHDYLQTAAGHHYKKKKKKKVKKIKKIKIVKIKKKKKKYKVVKYKKKKKKKKKKGKKSMDHGKYYM